MKGIEQTIGEKVDEVLKSKDITKAMFQAAREIKATYGNRAYIHFLVLYVNGCKRIERACV